MNLACPRRYLRYAALLAVLAIPAVYSQAQVGVGVRVGPALGYYGGPPSCAYGYYNYAPYACAPYGYYGPSWFSSGVFIGAGPWYRGYGFGRGYYGRGFYGGVGYRGGYFGRGYAGRGYAGRGYSGRGYAGGARGFSGARGYSGGGMGGGGGGFHGGGHR